MQKDRLRHPPSLTMFFATEMWERYGFYVVQTLLALYLAMHFKWHDKEIYALVGSFTALTYLSPIIGGWVADKLIGQKKAIIAGAAVLFASYLTISMFSDDTGLTLALAGIAVGTGLLKPNISSLLGNEYLPNSPNRESGFTIFYMGITTGIILGTTLPSYIIYYFNWGAAFASAAVGMGGAIIIFTLGIRFFKIKDYSKKPHNFGHFLAAVLIMTALWWSSFYILHDSNLADKVFVFVSFIAICYLLFSIRQENPHQALQTLAIAMLCIISVLFWAFYFQMFLSLTLFISRAVDPTLFGIQFPPPLYVCVQSLGMIGFGLILTQFRRKLGLADKGADIANKFLLSMSCMVAAYIIIVMAFYLNPGDVLLSPLYLLPAYLMISLAELLLSPVGLSAITILASRQKVSTMMGIFFVSLGVGGFLSGKLAAITAIPRHATTLVYLKSHYQVSFIYLLRILIIATLISFVLNLIIKHVMRRAEKLQPEKK